MRRRIFKIQHTPGFRVNVFDLVFLSILGGMSWGLWRAAPEATFWALPVYLGGSFFLFCNVFRIGNKLEVCWYVPFVLIAGYSLATNDLRSFWWLVVLVLEPVKWALVGYRILCGPYWGIGYARVGNQSAQIMSVTGETKSD